MHADTAIDLFAGLGGFTEGAVQAGLRVLLAANHWAAALSCHAANHPGTDHVTEDLNRSDCAGLPAFNWLLASPSCVGHTRARGKEQPRHDAARATAWAVVRAAAARRPGVIVIENVVEFQNWREYQPWCDALEELGYRLSPHVLDAADLGVPQHRVRLFIVGTRSRAPVRLRLEPRPHVPIGPHLRWGQWAWSEIARPGRAPATLARVARGRAALQTDRFLIPYYGSGSGQTGRSLSRPLGTVTTRDRWALIDGDRMRMSSRPSFAPRWASRPATGCRRSGRWRCTCWATRCARRSRARCWRRCARWCRGWERGAALARGARELTLKF